MVCWCIFAALSTALSVHCVGMHVCMQWYFAYPFACNCVGVSTSIYSVTTNSPFEPVSRITLCCSQQMWQHTPCSGPEMSGEAAGTHTLPGEPVMWQWIPIHSPKGYSMQLIIVKCMCMPRLHITFR